MKFIALCALMLVAMTAYAEVVPTTSAQIVANKDSPTETDLVLTISNPTKTAVSVLLPNDDDDRFEMLNLKVTNKEGAPVAESDKAKAFKAREVISGSSAVWDIDPGKKHEVIIPLSIYFCLPTNSEYTVTGTADNMVDMGDKVIPVFFKVTKAADN